MIDIEIAYDKCGKDWESEACDGCENEPCIGFSIDHSLNDYFILGTSGNAFIGDTLEYRSNVLEENKIKNEIDFLKYLSSNYNRHDNNWFTNSIKEMRNDYMLADFINFILNKYYDGDGKLTIITGDYQGWILEYSDFTYIRILNGQNIVYEISLVGEKYTNYKYIYELISTMVMDHLIKEHFISFFKFNNLYVIIRKN